MSRVVFIGWNACGHINPTLALVNELVNQGEEVYYFSKNNKKIIENTGCIYVENKYLSILYESFQLKLEKQTESDFIQSVTNFYGSLEFLFVLLDKFKRELIKFKPDYIIHDSGMHFIKYVCKELSIPCISSVTLFALNRNMFEASPDLFSNLYNVKLETNVSDVIKRVDNLADNYAQKHNYFYDFFDNVLSKENLNIVYTSKLFQPYTNFLDDSFHFAGNNLAFRIENEGSCKYKFSKHKKIILVSLGSILSGCKSQIAFYKQFMRHFAKYNAIFIINIGNIERSEFGKLPNNFILQNNIYQLELLKLADLFITHGGMNSVSEAIQFNTPMIVLPQIIDQFIVARQVSNYEMGEQYTQQNIDFFEIEYLITEILINKKYIDNTKLISETYKSTGEEKGAVNRIFKYIGKY